MKRFLLPFILLFTLQILHAQTYTIPGATEQPAWVFPLWFEDALGNKDTLYFGYDPEAEEFGYPQTDTIWGEKYLPVDTGEFNIVFSGGVNYTDSGTYGIKVIIAKLENTLGSSIAFYHTWFPPLTLRWDKNLFYSDVLPFPENVDAPRAWGLIETNGDMVPEGECSYMFPYIMTDTPTLAGIACYHADSMVFQYGSLSVLFFLVLPWQPYWTGIENITIQQDRILVYPNPLQGNELTISAENSEEIILEIFNIQSSLIYKTKLAGSNSYPLFIDIPPGMYILQCNQNTIFQTSKFIKL
ncbi:MAG: T9SS type A sorting domain-containing protein [Bacteroidia bacterium]|nr:T9SS type A sorting domain-containing protein [Bacteroidia bacterium]